jgi:hypothetical protein
MEKLYKNTRIIPSRSMLSYYPDPTDFRQEEKKRKLKKTKKDLKTRLTEQQLRSMSTGF